MADSSEGQRLVGVLLKAAPDLSLAALDELERKLVDSLATARRTWPDVNIADDEFVKFVGDHLASDSSKTLDDLQVADLYLSFACLRGNETALSLFERVVMPKATAGLARINMSPAAVADAAQAVRMILFVAEAGAQPKIAQYAGHAPLWAWVKVVATRAALRLKRGEPKQSRSSEDDALLDLPASGDTPEINFLKRRYKDAFRQAFLEALAALPPRERTLLRQSFIDGLSIDELGSLYGVHRSTASRWIVQARRTLLAATRDRLMAEAKISEMECDSVIRLVNSRFDGTIRSILSPTKC